MNRTRRPFEGAAQIIAFNWPLYAAATVALAVLGWLGFADAAPALTRVPAMVGFGVAAYFSVASIAVSYYVYDRSRLYQWRWVRARLRGAPARWVNIHAGLDESTVPLEKEFGPPVAVLDVFSKEAMTEGSIARARRRGAADDRTASASEDSLPLEDRSCDCVFLVFAAHELRASARREALFREVRRALAEGGTVVVVEHLRDLANFAAFGPGFLHFLSPGTWRRTFEAAGLEIVSQFKVTPFVQVWTLSR